MSNSSIRPLLDKIEKPRAIYLKDHGFVKKGRTFNRETEKGITQVINLQSGSFPIGDYVIPGFRESYYGKFTVNLGIAIEEVWKLEHPYKQVEREDLFWQESECTIRTRLAHLMYSKDHWWEITSDTVKVSGEIIDGLNNKALSWLKLFENRKKICKNFTSKIALRANLDKALIIFFQDKDNGIQLLQKYYDRRYWNNLSHKEYVYELAESMGVKLNK